MDLIERFYFLQRARDGDRSNFSVSLLDLKENAAEDSTGELTRLCINHQLPNNHVNWAANTVSMHVFFSLKEASVSFKLPAHAFQACTKHNVALRALTLHILNL